ncbi:GGDEF domain-containing protein [Marinobacterium sediminicola]|uniref:diguanylate cyclase n=1 Tax=Marinobacterium sediminicola TaxID=518898 RepID=A0ABY1S2N2_9GAMM|nr:diguanylate cyclase [Marinobacterium sediminicola]ULG68856.1 diguanylate cyclase [Marinobacterium sediminicola]SMR77534.1 diguanylate cyclase (GGDEF) domain-containing protein [Marinobacterium sediminicola]
MQGTGNSRIFKAAAISRDKRKVAGYVMGLLLIAVAITYSHFIIDRLITRNNQDRQTVNMGYQQNMQAQRINHLAFRYILSSGGHESDISRQQLASAVNEMYDLHLSLLKTPPSVEYAAAADAIYFDAQHELDLKIRTYLGAARELAEKPAELLAPDSPLARFLERHNTEALQQGLNLALERYKAADSDAVTQLRRVLWGLFVLVLLLVILEWRFVFHPIFNGLERQANDYRKQAHTDPLTGCYNRRHFMIAAEEAFQRLQLAGGECSLLVLDIDYFKWVNDSYGHCTGDEVIQALVDSCMASLKKTDLFGRLGGEEFAILLPDTGPVQAAGMAEQLRQQIEKLEVNQYDAEARITFTVSIGVTDISSGDLSPVDAINRADIALYQAKSAGRNRVIINASGKDDDRSSPAIESLSALGAES